MSNSRIGINNLALIINNETIPYKPNSLSFCDGKGEYKARSMTTGGGGVDVIFTEDAESKIGTVKFSVEATDYMNEKIRTWKEARLVYVQLAEMNYGSFSGNFTRSFPVMTLVTNPETKASVDGDTELEFHGTPSI